MKHKRRRRRRVELELTVRMGRISFQYCGRIKDVFDSLYRRIYRVGNVSFWAFGPILVTWRHRVKPDNKHQKEGRA